MSGAVAARAAATRAAAARPAAEHEWQQQQQLGGVSAAGRSADSSRKQRTSLALRIHLIHTCSSEPHPSIQPHCLEQVSYENHAASYDGSVCPCCLGKGRVKHKTNNLISALLSFDP